VIAQRISTIKNASKILVLENGYLVEQGNFDELMTLNRVFAGLAKRQVSEG
jgi:ABC-type multidrug transport system fused ATPase/permease subunit